MAGGLTIRSVNVRTGTNLRIDMYRGLHDGLELDGEDDIIMGASGMDEMPRIKRRRILYFRGRVTGYGNTLAERREDFDESMSTLFGAIGPGLSSAAVIVTGPYLGIPEGEERTIMAKYHGDALGDLDPDWAGRRLEFTMECVSSPPDWDIGSSS